MSGRRNGPTARRRGAAPSGRATTGAVPAPRGVEEDATAPAPAPATQATQAARTSPAKAPAAKAAPVEAEAPRPARHRVLEIEGELTVHTAADRRGVLVTLAEAGGDLDLDLSAVTELDTAGLQLLLLARREALRCGGNLTLTATSRAVDDVLAIAHLDRTLSGVDDAVEVAR